jgi:hypothetical protein
VAGRQNPRIRDSSASRRWAAILPEVGLLDRHRTAIPQVTAEARAAGGPGVEVLYSAVTKAARDEREPDRTVAEQVAASSNQIALFPQDRLNKSIQAKICRLERPSLSSVCRASLYSRLSARESLVNEFQEPEDEEEDNANIDDDNGHESMTDSELLARPPKIWISKTASMEHDLD